MFRKIARVVIIATSTVIVLLVNVIPVLAATSIDVTITWTPGGVMFAPTNFTATVVNDNNIQLDWTPNGLAVTTLILGKVGSYPTSATDGYIIYNGAGATTNDTAVSLDETTTNMFYAAYSVDGGGGTSPDSALAMAGGIGMTLLSLAILALGLTVAMIIAKNMMLGFPSAIFWAVLCGFMYTQSLTTWDWQYLLSFASGGMVIFSCLAMYALRKRDLEPKEADWLDSGKYVDEGRENKKNEIWVDPLKLPFDDGMGIDDTAGFGAHHQSQRAEELHKRAARRRSGVIRKPVEWGEFK